MILTLKGYRYIAAGVSMVEVVIYVVGLGLVLDNLNEIQNLVAYAVGYGCGVIIGMKSRKKWRWLYYRKCNYGREKFKVTVSTKRKRIRSNRLVC